MISWKTTKNFYHKNPVLQRFTEGQFSHVLCFPCNSVAQKAPTPQLATAALLLSQPHFCTAAFKGLLGSETAPENTFLL